MLCDGGDCQVAVAVLGRENSAAALNMDAVLRSDRRMQQSIVSKSKPCQYGNGFSDSVDIYRRKAGRLD